MEKYDLSKCFWPKNGGIEGFAPEGREKIGVFFGFLEGRKNDLSKR